MRTVRCSGRLLKAGGVSAWGVSAQGVSTRGDVYQTPLSQGQNNRRLWKHNLSATTVVDGNNIMIVHNLTCGVSMGHASKCFRRKRDVTS